MYGIIQSIHRLAPKSGALLLNVSLRDYQSSIYDSVKDGIVVDDWDEVCRENTDIQLFHDVNGLQQENTTTMADVILDRALEGIPQSQPVMFNPMGMAIFDMAIAAYYHVRQCVRFAEGASALLEQKKRFLLKWARVMH